MKWLLLPHRTESVLKFFFRDRQCKSRIIKNWRFLYFNGERWFDIQVFWVASMAKERAELSFQGLILPDFRPSQWNCPSDFQDLLKNATHKTRTKQLTRLHLFPNSLSLEIQQRERRQSLPFSAKRVLTKRAISPRKWRKDVQTEVIISIGLLSLYLLCGISCSLISPEDVSRVQGHRHPLSLTHRWTLTSLRQRSAPLWPWCLTSICAWLGVHSPFIYETCNVDLLHPL